MKNTILTLGLFLACTLFVNAQKCKPKYTDKDDFTETEIEYWGGTLTSMSVYSYGVGYSPRMYVYKDNGNDKVIFGLAFSGKLDNSMVLNNHTWFEKGSKIIIKLENEFIELIVEKSTVNQSGYTSAEIVAPITKEQIEKMNSQKLEKARIYPFIDSEDMLFQFSIAKGRDKKMKQQLNCYLKL